MENSECGKVYDGVVDWLMETVVICMCVPYVQEGRRRIRRKDVRRQDSTVLLLSGEFNLDGLTHRPCLGTFRVDEDSFLNG